MFQKSPTSSWNVSTGTIYPLVRKLVRLALISAHPDSGNVRSARRLRLEPSGRDALVQWLGEAPTWLADPSADPIRTRLLFIGELPPIERAEFVRNGINATRAAIDSLKVTIERISGGDDRFEYLAHLGALAQLEARRDWLEQVERAISTD